MDHHPTRGNIFGRQIAADHEMGAFCSKGCLNGAQLGVKDAALTYQP